jgi:hypothetical protein
MSTSAGIIAMGKGADVGVGKKTSRKRAVGTREHIIEYLGQASELFDANGMASTQLAAAVGYPGSSVAFAQLLSGMERSGLIEREVRGKRTYRISLGSAQASPGVAAGSVAAGSVAAGSVAAGSGSVAAGSGSVAAGPWGGARRASGEGVSASLSTAGAAALARAGAAASLAGADGGGLGAPAGAEAAFDYDELARRLLVQVVRRLAVTDAGGEQEDPAVLQETVTGLEQELASAWTRHGKLAEENIRLREQLKVAQQSLALARERLRELPATADLDRSEVALLQRLLSPEYSGPEFGAGPGSDADARRLLS